MMSEEPDEACRRLCNTAVSLGFLGTDHVQTDLPPSPFFLC